MNNSSVDNHIKQWYSILI